MPPKSYDPPSLTPQFCFNSTALRDFLRLSRSTIDDSITQNLNSLLTPGSTPWDPSTVNARQISVPPGSKRPIDAQSCQVFKERVLFPSWQSRSDVLNYCASVATSPDPEDPDQLLREVESERHREQVVDERLDPYSARYFPREPRTQYLAENIRRERAVEDIIRNRTWQLVGERCAGTERTFDQAFGEWRRSRESYR
jgi:hypothetical protein